MSEARPWRFRKRLASLISRTRWVDFGRSEELARKWAPQLWLSPEALIAAYAIIDAERKKQGIRGIEGRRTRRNAHMYPQILVWMPKPVWEAFQDWCDAHDFKGSVALRALVQLYLCGTFEPAYRGQGWFFKGRIEKGKFQRERALITHGAMLALSRRAKRVNADPAAIVRGLVLELIEGRIRTLTPIDARSMWDDPDRYPYPT